MWKVNITCLTCLNCILNSTIANETFILFLKVVHIVFGVVTARLSVPKVVPNSIVSQEMVPVFWEDAAIKNALNVIVIKILKSVAKDVMECEQDPIVTNVSNTYRLT